MSGRAEIARYAAGNYADPPQRLGSRYDAIRFLPEAGNTVVCHLDFDDPAHQAMFDGRRRMLSLPEAEKFLYTPVASLHMAVFEGGALRRAAPIIPLNPAAFCQFEDMTEFRKVLVVGAEL